jgi:pimeloyl-ACP methyl ester carboxylesterase
MKDAIGGACRILHRAVLKALEVHDGDASDSAREFRLFFIGHSLGGAVVCNLASMISQHLRTNGGINGLNNAVLKIVGICTLNGAITMDGIEKNQFDDLHDSRALVICGDADDVVPPVSSFHFFEALPMKDKRQLILPGGSHDLFAYKEQLIEEISNFIIDGVGLPLTTNEGGN